MRVILKSRDNWTTVVDPFLDCGRVDKIKP